MVFSLVSKEFELTLDVKAAQSSINHIIIGNASFGKKMDALCDGMSRAVKNSTTDYIANVLADKFYQKHIAPGVDIVKLRNEIPWLYESCYTGVRLEEAMRQYHWFSSCKRYE